MVVDVKAKLAVEDQQATQRLRTLIVRLNRLLRSTESSSAAELPPARVSVLLTVERRGPIRLADVAERERLNPTMLSRVVGHLVESGLMTRDIDPEDRRSAWLVVTDAGRDLAETIRAERTQSLAQARTRLTSEQLEQLDGALDALEALAAAMDEAVS